MTLTFDLDLCLLTPTQQFLIYVHEALPYEILYVNSMLSSHPQSLVHALGFVTWYPAKQQQVPCPYAVHQFNRFATRPSEYFWLHFCGLHYNILITI